jgi:hypothetical protein
MKFIFFPLLISLIIIPMSSCKGDKQQLSQSSRKLKKEELKSWEIILFNDPFGEPNGDGALFLKELIEGQLELTDRESKKSEKFPHFLEVVVYKNEVRISRHNRPDFQDPLDFDPESNYEISIENDQATFLGSLKVEDIPISHFERGDVGDAILSTKTSKHLIDNLINKREFKIIIKEGDFAKFTYQIRPYVDFSKRYSELIERTDLERLKDLKELHNN